MNSKVILTERTEYDQITGTQRKQWQFINYKQLNLGPVFEYISNHMAQENYREGLRYRVNYQKSDFEDETDAVSAVSVTFAHAHPSLDVQENWTPLEGQSKSGVDRDLNFWLNDLTSHDLIFLDRLEIQEKAAIIATRNKKPVLENLKKCTISRPIHLRAQLVLSIVYVSGGPSENLRWLGVIQN